MKATISTPETWKRILEIEIPEQDVAAAFDKKLNEYKKEMKLPGFRPGHVPPTLIKQRYGESIRAEIIDDLVQKSYKEACTENNLNPVAEAKVNEIKTPENAPIKVTIETQVEPEIEIKGYTKLKIKSTRKKIKDSDIDDGVKSLQDRLADLKDVQRASKKGDFLKLKYLKVVIDGEEKQDAKSPEYPVELGGENRMKDFDKALTGCRAGEVVDISIKFPKDYDPQLAGKTGEFKIEVLAVQEKIVPEVNEEFIKKLGDFKDEAALREQIREQLDKEEQERAKNEMYTKAIDALIKDNPFEVPPARVETFLDYMHQEGEKYRRGNEPVLSREEVKVRYEETAVRSLKRQRIIDFIAKKENIKATQEDVDKEIEKLSKMYNQEFETLKQTLRKNGTTNRIREDIREQKTLEFLVGEQKEPE